MADAELWWAHFDKPSSIISKELTKKCWFCKLLRPVNKWSGHFCDECWNGFIEQGKARDKDTLTCFLCGMTKPLDRFYREHIFRNYAPWCDQCRKEFIDSHKPPIISKTPKLRTYKCQKCHINKPASDFKKTESGNRSLNCNFCREEIASSKVIKIVTLKTVKCFAKTKEGREQRIQLAKVSGLQICSTCKIPKSLSEFAVSHRGPLGLSGVCLKCRKEKANAKSKARKLDAQIKFVPILAKSISRALAANIHDAIGLNFTNIITQRNINQHLETYRCRKCGLNKLISEFAKAPARNCGHDIWCKECSKARKIKHHQNQTWEQKITQGCKKRATDKHVPFNMKPEDLYNATGALPEFCPIFTDIRLDYNHGPDRRKWASVDRKVPALGYTSDNVWVVSLAANMAKSDATSPLDRKRIVDIVMGNIKPKTKNAAQPSLF